MSSPERCISYQESITGQRAMIEGTRVSVADIARLYQLRLDEILIEAIVESLPHLTQEQVGAAIDHWRQHPEEIAELIDKENRMTETAPTAW